MVSHFIREVLCLVTPFESSISKASILRLAAVLMQITQARWAGSESYDPLVSRMVSSD